MISPVVSMFVSSQVFFCIYYDVCRVLDGDLGKGFHQFLNFVVGDFKISQVFGGNSMYGASNPCIDDFFGEDYLALLVNSDIGLVFLQWLTHRLITKSRVSYSQVTCGVQYYWKEQNKTFQNFCKGTTI